MRVLLVDDTDDSREVIRVMLQALGHEVVEATNGKDAVAAAIRRVPELGLIDLAMPDVDGLQVIGAVRAISSLRDFPIIAMTAYPQHMTAQKAKDAGCNAYLAKPFNLHDLSLAVDRFSKSA